MLKRCSDLGVMKPENARAAVRRLLPAQQRSIDPIVSSCISSSHSAQKVEEKPTPSEDARPRPGRRRSNITRTPSKANVSGSPTPIKSTTERRPVKDTDNSLSDLHSTPSAKGRHPLVGDRFDRRGNFKVERLANYKRHSWPEFPEVPEAREFTSLRKRWLPLLSISSIDVLFPGKFFSIQDAAIPGVMFLREVVAFEAEDPTCSVLVSDLDLVLQWIVIAWSSRETTKGTQAILSLISDLFLFLQDMSYTFNDLEASIILPYLLEKSSVAKVSISFRALTILFVSGRG
jgi:hypothetical protein